MKIELETNKWRFESHVNENELRLGNETSVLIIIYCHVYDIHIAMGHFILLLLGGIHINRLFYVSITFYSMNCSVFRIFDIFIVLTYLTNIYHVFIAV